MNEKAPTTPSELITVPKELKVKEVVTEAPTAQPQQVELITGVGTTEVVDYNPVANEMKTTGGYSNLKTPVAGTRYETGMPISIDAATNPQTGDPQVPKLT